MPGDQTTGYLGRGEALTVHTADCPCGTRLCERDSERRMQVAWAEKLDRTFETYLSVLVKNGKEVRAYVAPASSAAEADFTHLEMDPEPAEDSIELRLLISVRDRVRVTDVLRTLRRLPVVLKMSRHRLH